MVHYTMAQRETDICDVEGESSSPAVRGNAASLPAKSPGSSDSPSLSPSAEDSALSEAEKALKQAERERAAIVRKYDIGREAGAQIDPWEDPGFEIYHTTDRYGFIQDTRLPDYFQPKEMKLRDVEVQREKKWRKMLVEWHKYENTEKLHKRIYKGIPNSLRGRIWGRLLKVPQLQEEQKNKYEEMKTLARKWSPDIRQIDLDVNRTYRDHLSFRDRYGIQQKNLFHVLGAYSMYNQEIGYCQGMSQIAALLLMYMEEEEAFWALSALMADRRYAMHGFFISGFPKLLRFKDYHSKILEKFLPKLKRHLDKNMVDPLIYALKWFFQCFLDRVPFSLTLRLWDIYLLEGECILTAQAYNIFKLHRKTLMKSSMDDILHFLQNKLEKDFLFDDDYVVQSLQKCMDELRRAKMLNMGPASSEELPKKPFGLYVEPPLSQKIGRRSNFTNEERRIKEDLIRRQDKELMDSLKLESMRTAAAVNGDTRHSRQGSQCSEGPSIDEVSSVGHDQRHRNSMSSVTATSATFSVHSSHTLSQSQQLLAFSRTPPRKRIGSAQSEGSLHHENGQPPAAGVNGNLSIGSKGSPFSAAIRYQNRMNAAQRRGGGAVRDYKDRRAGATSDNNNAIWSPGPKPPSTLTIDTRKGQGDGEDDEDGRDSVTPTARSPRTFPNTPDTVRIYVPYTDPVFVGPNATSTPKAPPSSRENGDLRGARRPVSTSPLDTRRDLRKDFFSAPPLPPRDDAVPASYHQEDPNRVTIRVDPRDSVSWPRPTSPSSPSSPPPGLSHSAPSKSKKRGAD